MRTAKEVYESIIALNLSRHVRFDTLSLSQFETIYNGIGPDSWPKELRNALTEVYANLEELPGVHDVDYYFSDGTGAGWEKSQKNWLDNSKKIVSTKYPLWKFWLWRTRYLTYAKALAAYEALETFSFSFYVDAFLNHTEVTNAT